jgi:hypothetical protein
MERSSCSRWAKYAAKGQTGKEWLVMKKKDDHADPAFTLKSELTPERLKTLAVRTPLCETSVHSDTPGTLLPLCA